MRNLFCLALVVLGMVIPTAEGHYHMLLLGPASTKRDEPVRLTFQFGHPFEHQLFDSTKPHSLVVLAPDGKKTDLLSMLEPASMAGSEGKKVRVFQLRFIPEQRGDYVFVAQTEPVWMEEDREFFVDTVKVVLHVQAQKGWDGQIAPTSEMTPLTRPYGLLPGMVFQVQTPQPESRSKSPRSQPIVEVERYHPRAPKELPPDELITRTVKADTTGVATTTLTEPGWWGLTAARDGGEREREGKTYPIKQRATLWVYVQEKPGPQP